MRYLVFVIAIVVGCGSGGIPDAGSTASGVPADAGATANDCDGLRFVADAGPAAAGHFIVVRDSTNQDGCSPGATTGTGMLALEMDAEVDTLDFVTPSGMLLASTPTVGTTEFFGEQAIFFDEKHISETFDLQAYGDSGNSRQDRVDISQIAEDPTGGLVGLKRGAVVGMDDSLATRWTAQCPEASSVALAVDRSGATLYVFDGHDMFGANTMAAMWVDAQGNAGQPFEFLGALSESIFKHDVILADRVASGFFVQIGANWIGQIDTFSMALSPPPGWLAARPNTTLHMVRGGKGYAVIQNSSGTCVHDVGLTQFRGHLRNGEYGVRNGREGAEAEAAVHG